MQTLNLFNPVDYKSKPENCMAIVITGCHAKLYTGNGTLLQKLALIAPGCIGQAANSFLQYIDGLLDLFLHFYPLPVVVFGSPVTITEFKNITSHRDNIVNFFAAGSGFTEDAIKGVLRTSVKQAQ